MYNTNGYLTDYKNFHNKLNFWLWKNQIDQIPLDLADDNGKYF